MPHPPDTANWTAYDWEKYLRESDRYAAHFFELLKRFCDLPGARELIAQKMGKEFKGDVLDCSFDCDHCDSRWDCEFSNFEEMDELPPPADDDEDDDSPEDAGDDRPMEPGDMLFYETEPAFNTLRQTAIGWCNVYAAILPPDTRPLGLKILFHLGRALANLAYSIGDGTYEQPAASVALGKRSLDQLNTALGLLAELLRDRPRLAKILGAMKTHLFHCQEAVEDHVQKCHAVQKESDQGSAQGATAG